jgi:small subunit ribosomal protein S14
LILEKVYLNLFIYLPMAKKSMVQRQKKRQALEKRYRQERSDLKARIKQAPSLMEKFVLYGQVQKLPRNSSATRLHNRCLVSGRPKAYYRDFGLSRHVLREMGHQGLLPGLTKSSW